MLAACLFPEPACSIFMLLSFFFHIMALQYTQSSSRRSAGASVPLFFASTCKLYLHTTHFIISIHWEYKISPVWAATHARRPFARVKCCRFKFVESADTFNIDISTTHIHVTCMWVDSRVLQRRDCGTWSRKARQASGCCSTFVSVKPLDIFKRERFNIYETAGNVKETSGYFSSRLRGNKTRNFGPQRDLFLILAECH